MKFPFGEKSTLFTEAVFSFKMFISCPFSTFHILTVSSAELEANKFPSGEKQTYVTSSECPS